MIAFIRGCLIAIAMGWLIMPAHSQTGHMVTVPLNGQAFTLPMGFTIELAAGPPLVDRPITIDFDEAGRLYVAESSGSNENIQLQLAKKPHRILRLEDTDGDGVFDRRTVFAKDMMFPEGTMWHRGSLYVAAPPSIWKLTDTRETGVADQRVEWFKGKTLTGCANDLHGPYLGPDGWIYWGKGAFAPQTYERPGQKPLVTKAAHVFRCRPDGTGLEPVITGGMDNPVDIAFTSSGEPIFTSTFLQYPAGGKRDGLLHAVHGGLYGKEYLDVLNPHVWTSPKLMPVLSHLGPAAVSGLTRYESRVFGAAYQDNFFTCLFNLQKVTRHVLTQEGSTFRSEVTDFVVSSSKDFHPTDVVEDADGSLLIVDTGGWYKLCCPTSQLVKPDVLGAIYRVRKVGSVKIADPRGLAIAWTKSSPSNLVKLLDDPRPAVRRRAKETLIDHGKEALPSLEAILTTASSAQAKREAVWTLVSLDLPQARALTRLALKADDETVRQVALHGISRWRDEAATPQVLEILKSESLHNRRVAAEALGKISTGSAPVIAALQEALAQPNDHVLHHSLTFALIEIGDPYWTLTGLKHSSPAVRRASLMAAEQLAGKSKLTAGPVVQALGDSDPDLRATAWWIAVRHPEWGQDIARYLAERLTAKTTPPAERRDLIDRLAKSARAVAIQELLANWLKSEEDEQRRLSLVAMAQANLKDVPAIWLAGLADVLQKKNSACLPEALVAAQAFHLGKQTPPALSSILMDLGNDATQPTLVRLSAMAALPSNTLIVSPDLFHFLIAQAKAQQPLPQRGPAADILARARLSQDQLQDLAKSLSTVGPLEIDRMLDAFADCRDRTVGQHLLDSLQAPNLKNVLSIDGLKRRLKSFPPPIQEQAQKLYASLNAQASQQRTRLEALLEKLPAGDVRRGQALFNLQKSACVSCHAIGYVGGKLGPDLTRIGATRTQRDLLEAILFPSASFVRGYEPVVITTNDGKVHNGLIRSENPDEVIFATGLQQDTRIARGDINDIHPSRISIMPAGLDQQLSQQDLADLVAFLQACK